VKKQDHNYSSSDTNITSKVLILLGAFLFIAGCTSVIVKDDAPPPIENGLRRLETTACGHYGIGNNICWVDSKTNPKDVDISVGIYFEGRLVLKSSGGGCSIDDSITVQEFGPYKIDLAKYVGVFSSSCILDLIYQPKFPGQESSDAKVRGMFGRVVIMFSDREKAELSNDQTGPYSRMDDLFYSGSGIISIRQSSVYSTDDSFVIGTRGSDKGTIRIDGCGLSPLIFSYTSQNPRLSIKNLIRDKMKTVDNCIFTGIIVPQDKPDDLAFALILEVFSKQVVFLQTPDLQASKDRLIFSSTGPVSWTFVGDKAFNKGSGKVDIEDGSFIIRQVTAVGRTRIVKYENGYEVWSR
jgi:hypothetical protein